ncbi:MAG: hypothetical protein KDD44_05270, partial [Bdellovibrionales bacterium]|nr:hypothetical protein [Bdellovibrionales bacterium]
MKTPAPEFAIDECHRQQQDLRMATAKFRQLCGLVIAVLLRANPTVAAPVIHPEALGPFRTTVISFPELRDHSRKDRKVPIKVHMPSDEGPFPVVVLSHGGGGNWDANYAQAEHLASHGYTVLALEHVGSNTKVMRRWFRFMANLKAMTRSADEVLGRPKDISFALDQAALWNRADTRLAGRLDLEHIGMLGHSFGAYTTLAACGARPALDWLTPEVAPGHGLGPNLRDERIDAAVALSPQGPGEPFFLPESYRTVTCPTLGISGTRDEQQGARPEHRKKFFELLPPGQKLFIWLTNADHTAFSDSTGAGRRMLRSESREQVQPIVRAATLLFFEWQLRGNA